MGKIEAVTATVIGIKEVIDGISIFFTNSIPKDYYKSLDELTFLNNKTLGLDSYGNIFDSSKIIGDGIYNLSNIIIWGILLFYGFVSIFGYFLSGKIELPWKTIIRTVIFGVLINTSFFICYSAVYFTENITEYLIDYCGGETSFLYLENMSRELDMEIEDEIGENYIFSMEELMKISSYILIFLFNIVMGMRFILLKIIIIFSPVIFAFGCSKLTEKIFLKCSKLFLRLLTYQIIIVIILEIFSELNFTKDYILQIILISVMLLSIRIAKKIY